jgi:hypothetical protein
VKAAAMLLDKRSAKGWQLNLIAVPALHHEDIND